jgi:hypothetical protein
MPFRQFRNQNAGPRGRRAVRARRSRRDWIEGQLVELDPAADSLVLRVRNGGRPMPPRGTEVSVSTASARIHSSDGDGDGRFTVTDLFPGDELRVTLRPTRHGIVAAHVYQQSPGAPTGGLAPLWHRGGSAR